MQSTTELKFDVKVIFIGLTPHPILISFHTKHRKIPKLFDLKSF